MVSHKYQRQVPSYPPCRRLPSNSCECSPAAPSPSPRPTANALALLDATSSSPRPPPPLRYSNPPTRLDLYLVTFPSAPLPLLDSPALPLRPPPVPLLPIMPRRHAFYTSLLVPRSPSSSSSARGVQRREPMQGLRGGLQAPTATAPPARSTMAACSGTTTAPLRRRTRRCATSTP